MKFEDLKKEPKVNEWLDAVNPKPVTEMNYLRAMEKYRMDWQKSHRALQGSYRG